MLDVPEHGVEKEACQCGADELDDDVTGQAPPRKVSAQGKRERDAGIQVRARHCTHEQDDRHDHQPGRHHGCGQADAPFGVENAAARRDEHQKEGAEQLREESAPL